MLRGCQKRVYVIRKPDSRLFEEAYFLLKPTTGNHVPEEAAMLREAERIVSEVYGFAAEYTCRQKKAGGGFGTRFFAFILGVAVSSAAIGSVALLLTFA